MQPNVGLHGSCPMLMNRYAGMSRLFSSMAIGLILLLTVVVPPFGILTYGKSMASGVLVVSGLHIFLFVVLCVIARQSQRQRASILLIATVVGVVVTYGAVSRLINDGFDFDRFWKSCLFLSIYLLAASFFTLLAQRVSNFQVDFAAKLVFYALVLSGLVEVLHLSPFSPGGIGPHVLLFSEVSHFALSFLPFLLYMTVTASPRMKLPLVLLGYTIALRLQNLTLVAGITLVAALAFPLRRFLLFATIALLSLLFADVNVDYYSSRMYISIDSDNLSALVLLSGWERAYLNFKDTLGLGVGFQQFGVIGSLGEAMFFIEKITGTESNLLDGGTISSKFVGEFGLWGVMMLLAYLIWFAKSARWLHEVSMSEVASRDCRRIFFLSCFVMYCIDLFIRGTGYFSSSGFLFIASLMWLAEREPE